MCKRVVMRLLFFLLMIRRPPRSTQGRSSAASDVYKRQGYIVNQDKELEGSSPQRHPEAKVVKAPVGRSVCPVSYTHLRAHETVLDLVCRLLLEKTHTTQIPPLSLQSFLFTFDTFQLPHYHPHLINTSYNHT